MASLYLSGAIALAISLLVLWGISMVRGHVSFIDAFWGPGFVIVGFAAARQVGPLGDAQLLMLTLLALWGFRLSLYLLKRYLTHGEDRRYVKIIGDRTGLGRHLYTLGIVFALQGALILLNAAPVIGLLAEPPRPIDGWAIAGAIVWTLGAIFEWGGDWQLARFKADPANEGKVLSTGLWAWTRHPNYFGDMCVWWGLWLIGHDLPFIASPMIMAFLLMKWSGVPMLERSLKKRREGYADYINRTSAFFPRPPK